MPRPLSSLRLGGALLVALAWIAQVASAAPDAGADAGAEPEEAAESEPSDAKAERSFEKAPPLPRLAEDGGPNLRAVVIPIHGTIDLGLAPFVRRALDDAQGAAVIVLDVDTFGGRVDAAVQIRDAILETSLPTVAYVNRRAISAGALISLAADHIVFTSGGTMGAATPVQMQGGQAQAVGEKMVSYMRSEMRATAEANGRDGELAEAMVDADVEIPGVSAKGKLLTATTDVALETGLATARIENIGELMKALGLENARVVEPSENWAERIARFLTDPIVSGLLMSLGMLGILLELYTPGFGVAGGLGLLCLMLFFGGHMIVDLAGWEELLLFGAGLVALAVEIFVVPGFGVIGILGLILLGASLVMAMLGLPLSTSWDVGTFSTAMSTVLLSLVGTTVAMVLMVKFLPRGSFGNWLVLQTSLGGEPTGERPAPEDFVSQPESWRGYVGRTGFAHTDLRPSGKVEIDQEIVDVVSRGDYIDRGERVRVVEVEGVRVVVVRDENG